MLEWLEWWPALFGWPAIIVSMGLAAAGIKLRKPVLLVVSAVLVAPLSLYLSGAASWFALTGPVILFWIAWCSLASFAGVAVWLAVIVISE